MANILDFITPFTQFFAPDEQISPVATPSAITALQGQFSTLSDNPVSAPLVARSTTTTTVTVKLRKTKMPGSAIDTTSPLTILVSLASGTINTATPSAGTSINATGLGTQSAIITVQPDASTGIVTVPIVSSGNIVATVMLRHRTFSTSAAIV